VSTATKKSRDCSNKDAAVFLPPIFFPQKQFFCLFPVNLSPRPEMNRNNLLCETPFHFHAIIWHTKRKDEVNFFNPSAETINPCQLLLKDRLGNYISTLVTIHTCM
jgi:hypothetical protein